MNKNNFFCLALWFAGALAQAQSNPVPFLNQTLVPSSTAPGGPNLKLTVSGTGFASASVVNWNGTPLQTTFVTDTQLTAIIPSADIASSGTASIAVSTPKPGGGTSNVVFFTVSTQTTPSFTQFVQSGPPNPNGHTLQAPVAVDVNGDGKLDIVSGWSGELMVLLGQGDGSFQAAKVSQLSGDQNAQTASTSVGDFNGDGKLDFALSNGATRFDAVQSTISVVLGNGDGTFGTPSTVTLAAGYAVNNTGVGDFNQDGKLDLVTGNNPAQSLTNPTGAGNPTLSILLGNGDGTFQAHVDYSISVTSLAVGDVNGDGKLDIVAGDYAVLLGNGDGTFASPILTGANDTFYQIVLQDVNGDGKLDLLGVDDNGGLVVSLGNGDGTFLQGVSYDLPVGTHVLTLATGDFNGDGKIDVALGNSGLQAVSLLYGNGDGTFQAAQTFPSSSGVGNQLLAGDFTGDGKLDLFSESTTSSYLGTLYLQGPFSQLTSAPGSLTFSQQALGTTSTAQTIVLTNSGNATLAISGTSITGANSGDYAQSSNCGASLAVNASCQVSVTFTPTAQGTRNATLMVTDNAPGSPQTISLTGMTTPAPALTLSPSSITFAGQYVGTSGLPQTITATNSGDAALTISSVSTSSKDFGVLNACGSSLAAGASCSIGVFFDPASSGTISGALTIADNASGSPQTVPLSGLGQDFSFTSSSSTQTVAPGATATYTIAVNPIAGFNQTVALACSGAPAGSNCSLSSNSVTLSGSTPVSVTVSVTTLGNSAAAQPRSPSSPSTQIPIFFAICGLPGLLLWGGSRRVSGKRKTAVIYGIALLGIVCLVTAGCGGNSSSGGGRTPASTYTLTVTGTFASGSANLTQSTNLTLVVQ
jgi:hypothetical protein